MSAPFFYLRAPEVGLEPTTLRLTAGCSAIELLRNLKTFGKSRIIAYPLRLCGRKKSTVVLNYFHTLAQLLNVNLRHYHPS